MLRCNGSVFGEPFRTPSFKVSRIRSSDLNSQLVRPIGCEKAPVAELADAPALGAGVSGRVGSSPTRRTYSWPSSFRLAVPNIIEPSAYGCIQQREPVFTCSPTRNTLETCICTSPPRNDGVRFMFKVQIDDGGLRRA